MVSRARVSVPGLYGTALLNSNMLLNLFAWWQSHYMFTSSLFNSSTSLHCTGLGLQNVQPCVLPRNREILDLMSRSTCQIALKLKHTFMATTWPVCLSLPFFTTAKPEGIQIQLVLLTRSLLASPCPSHINTDMVDVWQEHTLMPAGNCRLACVRSCCWPSQKFPKLSERKVRKVNCRTEDRHGPLDSMHNCTAWHQNASNLRSTQNVRHMRCLTSNTNSFSDFVSCQDILDFDCSIIAL
jgi:hypothetical protein